MTIYAVHSSAGDGDAAFERMRLLKLGFSWGALVFGPLWLLAHRLWRPLAVFILAAALVGFAVAEGALGGGAAAWLYLLSALYFGFEGRALEGAALTRRGRPLADIVCAADISAAEASFLTRALAPQPPRGAPLAHTTPPPSAPPHVLGLFPEAGR
jgi:hypothetical protein